MFDQVWQKLESRSNPQHMFHMYYQTRNSPLMFLSCSYSTWHANLMGSSWFHGFTGPRWGTPRVTLDTRQVGNGEKKHGSHHSAHHFWPTGPGVPGISYIAAEWPVHSGHCVSCAAPPGQGDRYPVQSSVFHLHQWLALSSVADCHNQVFGVKKA